MMSKIKREKKQQHYVPQSYLKRFSTDEHSVFVFDKFTQKVFRTNIANVASERYFYDFYVDTAHELNIDVQLAENALGGDIEAAYSNIIDSILQKLRKNARKRVLRSHHKTSVSYFIALQAIRTKEHRSTQTQLIEKGMEAVLAKTSEHRRDEYQVWVDAEYVSLLQSLSMFGPTVQAVANALRKHIWLVGVNQAERPLYTSDHPVVRRAHKKDPYQIRSYAGLASEGIEIALPMTPKYILILCERTFHKHLATKDGGLMLLDNHEYIKYYNSLQVAQSYRQVYCPSDNFHLAKEMCKTHPELCEPGRARVLVE